MGRVKPPGALLWQQGVLLLLGSSPGCQPACSPHMMEECKTELHIQPWSGQRLSQGTECPLLRWAETGSAGLG